MAYTVMQVVNNWLFLFLFKAGKMQFLKPLLLPSTTLDSIPFKLGYNFSKDRVNRDRQR